MARLDDFLESIWCIYFRSRDASQAYLAFDVERKKLDHVAFRTFDRGFVRLFDYEMWLLDNGYVKTGTYNFKNKHLRASSYSNHKSPVPRVFVSELKVDEMPKTIQAIIDKAIDTTYRSDESPFCRPDLFGKITKDEYELLLANSEYAAWTVVNGSSPNHLAVSVDERIADVNQLLIDQGFVIATAGGPVKGGTSFYLEQGATRADETVYVTADNQTISVAAAYCEFAKRWIDPETGLLFDGFVEPNADKIFESTDLRM